MSSLAVCPLAASGGLVSPSSVVRSTDCSLVSCDGAFWSPPVARPPLALQRIPSIHVAQSVAVPFAPAHSLASLRIASILIASSPIIAAIASDASTNSRSLSGEFSEVSLGEVRLGLEKRIQRLLFAVVGASKYLALLRNLLMPSKLPTLACSWHGARGQRSILFWPPSASTRPCVRTWRCRERPPASSGRAAPASPEGWALWLAPASVPKRPDVACPAIDGAGAGAVFGPAWRWHRSPGGFAGGAGRASIVGAGGVCCCPVCAGPLPLPVSARKLVVAFLSGPCPGPCLCPVSAGIARSCAALPLQNSAPNQGGRMTASLSVSIAWGSITLSTMSSANGCSTAQQPCIVHGM